MAQAVEAPSAMDGSAVGRRARELFSLLSVFGAVAVTIDRHRAARPPSAARTRAVPGAPAHAPARGAASQSRHETREVTAHHTTDSAFPTTRHLLFSLALMTHERSYMRSLPRTALPMRPKMYAAAQRPHGVATRYLTDAFRVRPGARRAHPRWTHPPSATRPRSRPRVDGPRR